MPSYIEKENPFFFEAGLDTKNLKKSLSKSEKMYAQYERQINQITRSLDNLGDTEKENAEKQISHLQKQQKVQQDIGNAIRDQGKERIASMGKWRKASFDIKKGILSRIKLLDEEKAALGQIGINWQRFSIAAGLTALATSVYGAAKAYMTFDSQIRETTVSLGGQDKVMAASSGIIQSWTGYLNLSREELVAMNKQIGELKLVRGNSEDAVKSFRDIAKQTVHLAKAIDVGTGEVVGLFDTFTRVYGLPHHKLRNISAAMKFIQEETSISGQELMSFAQSLEDVTSRMIRATGEGKTKATVDMMAMAGVLKDMGVQPEKVSQMFGEAMKIHSSEGARFLSFIAEGTGFQTEQLRQMMVAGDVQTPLSLLIKRIRKESPKWLAENEAWLTETTKMTMAELMNIQRSTTPVHKLIAGARKAYTEGKKHNEAAMKRQHRLSTMWNRFKRVLEGIWLRLGKLIIDIVSKVATFLEPILIKVEKKLKDIGDWASSPQGARAITDWIQNKAIPFFRNLWSTAVKGFNWLIEKIKMLIEWWGKLSSTEKKVLVGGAAIATMFGGTIVQGITKAISAMGPWGAAFAAVAAAATYAGKKIIDAYYEPQIRMTKELMRIEQKQFDAWQQYAEFKYVRSQVQAIATMNEAGAIDTLRALREEGMVTEEGLIKYDKRFIRNIGDLKFLQKELNKALAKNVEMTKKVGEKSVGVKGILRKIGGASEMTLDKIKKAKERATVVDPLGRKVIAPGLESTIPTLTAKESQIAATEAARTKAVESAVSTKPSVAPAPATVAKAAPTPKKLASTTPPIQPQVKVEADDPEAKKILVQIRDAVERGNRQGTKHPSRAVLANAL